MVDKVRHPETPNNRGKEICSVRQLAESRSEISKGGR